MVEQRFINYFEFAGLNPDDGQEKNYYLLEKMHREMAGKPAKKAQVQADILNQAMAVFKDPEKYNDFLRQWQQRQPRTPQAGPGVQPDAGQAPAGPPQKGLKAMLIEIGASAIKNALEHRMNHAQGGLTGLWRDNFGCNLQVQQSGNNIAVVVANGLGYVLSEGRGVINGNKIDYQARDGAGQLGKGELWVSPDGSHIEGQISWYNGFNMLMGSSRVYLVRS